MSRVVEVIALLLSLGYRWLEKLDADRAQAFAILCVMTLCACSCSRPGGSLPIPSTPTLTSQKIVVLDGVRGWWIDERDAATLAQWIYDVTGEGGR